jgi:outer membrane protein assembly factor BamB
MNWRNTTATAVLALVVLFCMTGCPAKPPATPGVPIGADSTWTGASTTFKVTTTAKGNIRYTMDWSGKIETGAESYGSGETALVSHSWATASTYNIKVQAILDAESTKASAWSPTKAVKVIFNNAPVVIAVNAPPVAVKGAEAFFTIRGSDQEEDSLRVLVDWGSSKTDTGYFLSPCNVTVSHVFNTIETAMVVVTIQDWKGTTSAPDTVYEPVGTVGGVIWRWQSSDAENLDEPLTTSAIVANDGEEEVVMSGCEGDYKFYSIRASNGKTKKSATTAGFEYSFTGHPGLANGRIIVGSDEGELYALALDLGKDWRWPDSASERGTGIAWGAPAFNGYNIYVGHDDDSLFLFQDAGSQGNRIAAYAVHASVVDAPIIDATGNVIFGTDSGYLVKIDGNLNSPIWRSQLMLNGEVHGPILGSSGTIYCTDDSFRLHAIDPAGHKLWTTALDGEVLRPALGPSALFVGSGFGKAYSINPATGGINWEKPLKTLYGPDEQFSTTPIVAANGYVYFQSENDVLFCLNQADGTVIWYCDCPLFLPRTDGGNSHRPRKLGLFDYLPNPSITSTGNIIVVGEDATYCVAGYPERPLDPSAAWPKWQKNLWNAGK